MAGTEEQLKCFYAGLFIQDNIDDLLGFLGDAREWPQGTDERRDIDDVIAGRFDALAVAVEENSTGCNIPPHIAVEVKHASDVYNQGNADTAEEILETLEISEQVQAFDALGRGRLNLPYRNLPYGTLFD